MLCRSHSPLLVSLSLTRNEPTLLPEDNSSRSASFLLRVLKYHLGDREVKIMVEQEKNIIPVRFFFFFFLPSHSETEGYFYQQTVFYLLESGSNKLFLID